VPETNWAGNLTYSAQSVRRPTSTDELQTLVRATEHVHVVGSRHSFNAVADSTQLVSLAGLPQDIHVDSATRTATIPAGITYGALSQKLDAMGWAIPNMASLPHISVAGAVATGTHGSGDRNGGLASAVAGMELVSASGELVRSARGDSDFDGMVVNVGALGAVTRLTLDVEPTYAVRQTVFEGLRWRALLDNFDAITTSGYSVSLFTNWGEVVDQVWVKTRVDEDTLSADPSELFGARAARTELHPLPGMDPTNCTPQLGRAGAWWTRLTHFRVEHQPSTGNELHAEYMVPRAHAPAAIEVLRGMADRIQPLLMTSEIRTVAADGLWLSPMYERETVCLHFTWHLRQPEVEALLPGLEAALEPFEPRPHWGKLFAASADSLANRYRRRSDFLRLKARLDPQGKFSNDWFIRHVSGSAR
jgi:alditol oxidase